MAPMIGASMPRSLAMRAAIAAVATPSASGRPVERLAAPERQAIGKIARLRRCCRSAAGRRGRKGPSASPAARRSSRAMRRSSTKPRVTMRGLGAGAEPGAGDRAGGDGQDVLQRAADLDADEIVGRIAAEMLGRQSRAARSAARVLSRRRDRPPPSAGPWPRRWRSSGPTAPRPDCPGKISSTIADSSLPVVALDALGAEHDRSLSAGTLAATAASTSRNCCAGIAASTSRRRRAPRRRRSSRAIAGSIAMPGR